jgi:hypothetical protein
MPMPLKVTEKYDKIGSSPIRFAGATPRTGACCFKTPEGLKRLLHAGKQPRAERQNTQTPAPNTDSYSNIRLDDLASEVDTSYTMPVERTPRYYTNKEVLSNSAFFFLSGFFIATMAYNIYQIVNIIYNR